MEKFFTILLLSFVLAAVLERFGFAVLGVSVMWGGFLWSISHMPEPYSSADREQQTMSILVIGAIVLLIGAGSLYEALSNSNAPSRTPDNNQHSPEYFNGYECTSDDCSGHEAGYDWAKENRIQYTSDCSGNSSSFVEGCEAWVKSSPNPVWDMKE